MWGVVFLSLPFLSAQDIDHAAISAHAAIMKEAQIKKDKMYEAATKAGVAALTGYLIYYGYTLYAYSNVTVPLTVPEELVKELKASPAVIKTAIEQYAAQENSFFNSTFGSILKFTGSLAVQSIVFQVLQPVYKKIQTIFSSNVSVSLSDSWFLAEQHQGSPEELLERKVEIPCELAECIMQIESVEFAYTNHQPDLLKDSAQQILSHILFVKEHKTRYIYQRHLLQKNYDKLTDIVQQMISDASNSICDQNKLDVFKETIRELRKVPAYSIF